MRLSRTDLVPVLAIVAGGAIGASLSFSFLGRSPSADVRTIVPIVATYESVEVLPWEEAKANSLRVYAFERVEAIRRLRPARRLMERSQERREEAILALERARELTRSEERGSQPRP